MKVTLLGHASVLVEMEGAICLMDPVFFDLCMANSYLLLRRGSTNPRLPQISWVLRFPSIGRVSAPWAGAEVACCSEYAYAFDQSFWSN